MARSWNSNRPELDRSGAIVGWENSRRPKQRSRLDHDESSCALQHFALFVDDA
jgi:hypothetical protein